MVYQDGDHENSKRNLDLESKMCLQLSWNFFSKKKFLWWNAQICIFSYKINKRFKSLLGGGVVFYSLTKAKGY